MDEFDNFENYNLLYEMATFEHFATHDPQPRKCSEILNCDINKFMFICSQCHNEFENAEDYYIHQVLEHQGPRSQTELELYNWYETELLDEFFKPPNTAPQPKEFYDSVDKTLDMNVPEVAAQRDENIENVCDYLAKTSLTINKPIAAPSPVPICLSYSNDMQTVDIRQLNGSFEPSFLPIDDRREQELSSEDTNTVGKSTSDQKRKKKRTPGQCDVCNRSFNDTYNLRIHKMIHTGEMPFQCEDCGKGFRQYNKLKIHSIIHTTSKPFMCDLCGKGFRFRNYLAIHKRLHTGEKPYKCKLCDEHFHSLHNRRLHVKAIHLQKEESFLCTICGKTLSTKCYLQVHMRRHANQRDFKCEDCEQAFYTVTQLKEHMLSHTKGNPYQCDICQITFLRKTNYNQHLKIHLNAKSYTCRICNKTFAQNAGLYAHMKLHGQ